MDSIIETMKDLTKTGSQLADEVCHHPALSRDETKKKVKTDNDDQVAMDVYHGSQLDQIELATKLVADIDAHVRLMYKAIHSKYSYRFPELQLADPMQYIITTHLLGNKPDRISKEEIKNQLSEFLEPKKYLLISMSAATTRGIKIEPEEMEHVMRACSVAIHLGDLKAKLLAFVERNMTTIAPNLSVILGAPIAAKLLGLAGGLMNLITMPACNVIILGHTQRVSNMETDGSAPPVRVGHIYDCDLIQQIPTDGMKDIRKKAVKWVANKCVLAARCDLNHADPEGSKGKAYRDKIIADINRELEPPPKKAPRPLPAPIEKSGKKRGGKRVRRQRERYQVTELRKAANRIKFGDVGDDAYQNNLEFGRSQLNAINKLRGPQINEKTKIRLSKSAQKKLDKQNQAAKKNQLDTKKEEGETLIPIQASTSTSTSVNLKAEQQELVISNPKAIESYKTGKIGESSNYFSSTSGFFAVKRKE